jgi:type IV secretion system protein VirB11
MSSAATERMNPEDPRMAERFLRELGPFLREQIEDDTTEDICLNPDGRIWVKHRGGRGFEHLGDMMEYQALMLIGTVAFMREGKVVNSDTPILEVDLPIYKSRFEAIVPPVVTAPVFALRGRAAEVYTLADYKKSGIISNKDDPYNARRRREDRLAQCAGLDHVEVIELAIRNRWNILVAGSTSSGKTTLCNALLDAQRRLTPSHRTILIEDTPELNCKVENVVSMLSSLKTSMQDCLKATMRLNPDRISIGEVRGGEALTLLKAWNTGHSGGFATLHADDAYGALLRLQSLIAEATAAPQEEFIAQAVNLVLHIDGDKDLPMGRKLKEVALVTGFEDGRYQLDHV